MTNPNKALDRQPDQLNPTAGNDEVGNDELDDNELDGVTGGTTTTPAPKTTTVKPLFEIKDFSFDIEVPNTILGG